MTFISNQCRRHTSLRKKNQNLKQFASSLRGTTIGGIDRDLVSPVNYLVESSDRNCSHAKIIKTETIPILKHSAQSSQDDPSLKQQMNQLLGSYSKFMDDMDTCSFVELIPIMKVEIDQMKAKIVEIDQMKAKIAKFEAEKEVRAWIDVARELISKKLKTRFPNEFRHINGDIYWKDWVTLAKTNRQIYDGISEIANSLFGLDKKQWEIISKDLYRQLSGGFHTRSITTLSEAERLVDHLHEAPDTNNLIKQLFKKVFDIEQQTPIN